MKEGIKMLVDKKFDLDNLDKVVGGVAIVKGFKKPHKGKDKDKYIDNDVSLEVGDK